MTGDPNVLLVVLDSVRARNTSIHGHGNDTTPFLRTLAERATVFEQARAPGTWSLPSHASLFTGLHVAEHGMASPTDVLAPGRTMFDDLRAAGYETGVFSENPFLTVSEAGLADAFDTVEGPRNLAFTGALDPTEFVQREGQGQFAAYLRACLSHERPLRSLGNGILVKLAWDYPRLVPDRFSPSTAAAVYVDRFLDWEASRNGPWAACLNLMDAHLPYQPTPEHDRWGGDDLRALQASMDDQVWDFVGGRRAWWQREALAALYDGTIHEMDAQLRRLVRTLDRRDALDDTLLVVTSDHGECFGERSFVQPQRLAGHGPGIDETLLHVPLVVRYPGQESGERISRPASLTHVPRAVEAAREGDSDPSHLTSDVVYASYRGLPESAKVRAREYVADLRDVDGESRAAYVPGDGDDGSVTKYVEWRDRRATVRVRDARTSYRVADGADPLADLFADLSDRGVKRERAGEIDAGTEERLRDLGYM